jgi:flap endonuclease-1
MGIKGLNKLIKNISPHAIEQVSAREFCGAKIAIDSELLLHKYKSNDTDNSHIYGFMNNIFWFLENGITPIYVFDGRPSVAKQENVLVKRSSYKEQINEKITNLKHKCIEQINNIEDSGSINSELDNTLDQLFKIQKKLSYMTVTKNHRNECKYLLKLLGIPFIVAHEDAEAYCVSLRKNGDIDYIYTEDTDVIPYVIGHMPDNHENVKILKKGTSLNTFTVVDVGEIVKCMKLTPASFIDMCILCGCDFCKSVPKLGPFKAYNVMLEYGSIEAATGFIEFPENFKYQDARDIFCKERGKRNDKILDLGSINIESFKTYCFTERNMNPYPIIEKYHRIYNVFLSKVATGFK